MNREYQLSNGCTVQGYTRSYFKGLMFKNGSMINLKSLKVLAKTLDNEYVNFECNDYDQEVLVW